MTMYIQSRTSSQTADPFCQKPATSLLHASRKWTFRGASTRDFVKLGRLAGGLSSVDVAERVVGGLSSGDVPEGLAGELSSVDVVEGLVGLASAGGSDDGLSERR
jgi:hypothetical protein